MKTGAKWDDGKCDWSYLPSEAVAEVLKVYAGGAKKYGRGNYLRGIHFSRVFSAAMRHLWAWWRLEDKDEESGLSHLAHACWNVLTLLEYVLRERDFIKFDDRCTHDPLVSDLQRGLNEIMKEGRDSTGTLKICHEQTCDLNCQHDYEHSESYSDTGGLHTWWCCKKCGHKHLVNDPPISIPSVFSLGPPMPYTITVSGQPQDKSIWVCSNGVFKQLEHPED